MDSEFKILTQSECENVSSLNCGDTGFINQVPLLILWSHHPCYSPLIQFAWLSSAIIKHMMEFRELGYKHEILIDGTLNTDKLSNISLYMFVCLFNTNLFFSLSSEKVSKSNNHKDSNMVGINRWVSRTVAYSLFSVSHKLNLLISHLVEVMNVKTSLARVFNLVAV